MEDLQTLSLKTQEALMNGEVMSKSIAFLQQKQLFNPLVEAIRNTSMSCFNSIYQEEMEVYNMTPDK